MKKRFITVIKNLLFQKFGRVPSKNGFTRLYHNHIRKCAGTSMNIAMISALGDKSCTYKKLTENRFHKINSQEGPIVGWNKKLINRSSFFYAFSHEPFHQLEFDSDTFIFCLLRDPIERIVSHYRMLKDMIVNNQDHIDLVKEADWAYGDFDHFISNIPRHHLEAQLYNFSENYDIFEALENLKNVHYVVNVDESSELLIPKIENEFNLKIPYQHLRSSQTEFHLSHNQEIRLKELLVEEIEFYNRAKFYFAKSL